MLSPRPSGYEPDELPLNNIAAFKLTGNTLKFLKIFLSASFLTGVTLGSAFAEEKSCRYLAHMYLLPFQGSVKHMIKAKQLEDPRTARQEVILAQSKLGDASLISQLYKNLNCDLEELHTKSDCIVDKFEDKSVIKECNKN